MLAAPLAVILIGASAVGAQASTAATWTIANSPNATVTGGTIESVSCSAADACTAVGADVNTSGINVTLAERWDGSGWQRQSTPNPAGDTTSSVAPSLVGVSCPTAGFCVAVGNYQDGFNQAGMADTWNGQSWTAQSFPAPVDADGWQLTGVSCTSARFCEAVGGYSDEDNGTNDTFAASWNGTSWSLQTTVNPDPSDFQFEQFNAVSCASTTFCVGWASGNAGSPGDTMVEQWNGSSWALQTAPSTDASVDAVSCPSASFCDAVGPDSAYGWDGSAWTAQTIPSSASSPTLQAVSCTSRKFCEAVGESADNGNVVPAAIRWNGSAWAAQPAPNPAKSTFAYLNAVSCASSGSCEAGGYLEVLSNANDRKAFAEGWNSGAWQLQSAVAPAGATANSLSSVACVSATFCEAVGAHTNSAGNQDMLAETWNGQKWTIQSVPALPNPSGSTTFGNGLDDVVCVSAQFCEALGAGSAGAFALKWNGTSWAVQTLPGIEDVSPQAMSCPSADFCMMVDGFAQTETWDGTSWSAAPAPTGLTFIGSVSCVSASFCNVVGGGNEDSLAAQWNGTSWTTETLAGTVSTSMNSVSCTAATSCEAVGETPGSNDEEGTVAESWNGSAWTLQSAPGPTTTLGSELDAVSCASATSCTGVGSYRSSNVGSTYYQPETVVEDWNGTAWTLESSPNPSAGGQLGAVSCPSGSATCTAVGEAADEGGVPSTLIETGD